MIVLNINARLTSVSCIDITRSKRCLWNYFITTFRCVVLEKVAPLSLCDTVQLTNDLNHDVNIP